MYQKIGNMTTNTKIMSINDFNELDKCNSSLIFSGKYYDCLSYVDVNKLRSKFSKQLYKKKIKKILILTENYSKKQNKDIEYQSPLFCEDGLEGSQYNEEYDTFITYSPHGDVLILTN